MERPERHLERVTRVPPLWRRAPQIVETVVRRRGSMGKFFHRFRTERLFALGLLIAVLGGTGLLMLPAATVTGQVASFQTALFTATSAITPPA